LRVTKGRHKPEVRIVCPFCGGMAEIGYVGAAHSQPTCKTFDELDVEECVHQVYEVLRKTAKPEDQSS
jgi:hypothetical protein